ncbi:MAG: SAM-dependent methyltransferase [Pseudobutyrivibrio sp.]|nr:SAM-dependent methyltransferase [Pseudobutyrivibrio sp.]
MIKLSDRLQIVYDMVPKCHRVADVGCDHGYLTIALLENNKADNAIAMDVNKGPLQSAKANVTSAGFAGQTDFRLSNGLEKLSPSEADVICICGMGGALIKRILDAGMAVARTAKAIIIEPQSEYASLRQFLANNHFVILDEDLCTEEGKIYPIMKIAYDADATITLDEAQLTYGPVILEKRPGLLDTLLEKNKREFTSILEKISSKSNDTDSPIQKRIDELNSELALIRLIQLERED